MQYVQVTAAKNKKDWYKWQHLQLANMADKI